MEKQTLEALQGSIVKWDNIVRGDGKDEGCGNCPLCTMFYGECPDLPDNEFEYCMGCPVADAVGKTQCEGTPYHNFIHHSSLGLPYGSKGIAAARKELDFLVGLLPARVAPIVDVDRPMLVTTMLPPGEEKKSDSSSPVPNADGDPVQAGVSGGGSR